MEQLLWVCVAGAAGSGARYLIGLWAEQRFGPVFPFGTLIVNLAGCFAIAALVHMGAALGWPLTLRSTLTVGLIGGLTTYSAFNNDLLRLAGQGSYALAAANLVLTLGGGLLAGGCGQICARELVG